MLALAEQAASDRDGWHYSARTLAAVTPLPAAVAQQPMLPPAAGPRLVFSNGHYLPNHSQPGQVTVAGEAGRTIITLAEHHCDIAGGLEIVHHQATITDALATQSIEVHLGAGAHLNLLERFSGDSVGLLRSEITYHITLAARARLNMLRIQQEAPQHQHFATSHITLAAAAQWHSLHLNLGAALYRHALDVTLAGEGAIAHLDGIYQLAANRHSDTTIRLRHAAPHTNSQQNWHGIVGDRARGIFQGKVIVAKDAAHSDARQLHKGLLLSEQAEIDTRPELEIHTDAVQCSHGASIGALDADALFYLRARGIPAAAAEALLRAAFLRGPVQQAAIEPLRGAALAALGLGDGYE